MTTHQESEAELFEEEQEDDNTQIDPPGLKRLSTTSSSSTGSDRERVSGKRLTRFPVATRLNPSTRKMSGSVFNINSFPQAPGKSVLVRKSGKDDLDFWNDKVKGMDHARLEAILSLSLTDSAYDMKAFIDSITYQGFDRIFYIHFALSKMSVSMFSRFAILGAIRGSNFKKIVDTSADFPNDVASAFSSLGFVKTPKKREDLTILRCTASIPHWVAFWCNNADIAKKIGASDCHASLQFPGAASLPMSSSVRRSHINFCIAFSKLLPGGKFSTSIYMTAFQNQIPLKDIPDPVRVILGVANEKEASAITSDEVEEIMSKAVVRV